LGSLGLAFGISSIARVGCDHRAGICRLTEGTGKKVLREMHGRLGMQVAMTIEEYTQMIVMKKINVHALVVPSSGFFILVKTWR
jgi:hypothetical protein